MHCDELVHIIDLTVVSLDLRLYLLNFLLVDMSSLLVDAYLHF